MIFKEIDNTRDVGVICHYYQKDPLQGMLDPAGIAKGIYIINLGFSPLDDLLDLIQIRFVHLSVLVGIREVRLFILAIQDALQIAYILLIN